MFNHVQLHVHWLHLFNTRICRYTCIYITFTIQTLHYCPAGAWRWNDIILTSMRCYHVASTSFWSHVPAGCDQDRGVKSCPTLKMKSTVFSKVYFQQNLDTNDSFSLSAQPDHMWKSWKKIIARTHCFVHRSLFRPNYIFNNDTNFLDFRAQKFPLICFNVSPF